MDHVPLLVRLRPEQMDALRALAKARSGPGRRPPVSLVVREILDERLSGPPAPPARRRPAADLGKAPAKGKKP